MEGIYTILFILTHNYMVGHMRGCMRVYAIVHFLPFSSTIACFSLLIRQLRVEGFLPQIFHFLECAYISIGYEWKVFTHFFHWTIAFKSTTYRKIVHFLAKSADFVEGFPALIHG
tara:strand:+ start:349 stop:693 length:345 start_codon:yes stop_codon:yes gene_type:complete